MIYSGFSFFALGLIGVVLALSGVGCGRRDFNYSPTEEQTEQLRVGIPVPGPNVIEIRRPAGPPRIATGTFDEKGRPASVSCDTCHQNKSPNPHAKVGTPLMQFHQLHGGSHGGLTCISCHNPTDGYATLRMADGRSLPFSDVMTLCAQCHGPQFRDYQHGAHGGMVGYWDLAKGGRIRNNCIDCHHPHAPKYPIVTPAPRPRDRNPIGGSHE